MLLELAVGDAYGAAFEYAPIDLIRQHNTVSYYSKHPRHPLPAGCYTDDTQMSIAVTEAILSGERWTPRLLAHHFVQAFRRDPREGYAAGFYKLLCELQDGDDLLARIRPDSDKSGASMRAAPLGVFPTIGEVIDK
jgi:ADP-ribosyl-[dinitrogen reductase] hydrolase